MQDRGRAYADRRPAPDALTPLLPVQTSAAPKARALRSSFHCLELPLPNPRPDRRLGRADFTAGTPMFRQSHEGKNSRLHWGQGRVTRGWI